VPSNDFQGFTTTQQSSEFGFLVRERGLISYGAEFDDIWRHAAVYVDRILRGAKPGELPVEQPTRYYLVINLKTAKALGAHDPAVTPPAGG
jgi:putative ABC transport system substrate-binding protein